MARRKSAQPTPDKLPRARKLKPNPEPSPKAESRHPTASHDPIAETLDQAAREAERARAKVSSETFREHLAAFPLGPNYLFGRHTDRLTEELQAASDAVQEGRCVYRIVVMPPRHGKSDICSRAFPAWQLQRCPNHEVMLATYAADLAEGFSRVARKRFAEYAPKHGLRISDDLNQVGAWAVEGKGGAMFAVGLGGAVTGRGAHFLLIDDYCKNREEAESETLRDKVWDAFRNDLMTRLAPAHAVFITATRWHEDDLVGRIETEMQKNPEFPRFEFIHFPAQFEDGGWLFPERFSSRWYEAVRASVGSYAWESLYQGRPRPRTGRLLRADLTQIVDKLPEGLRWTRGWDLASTEKERVKDDPDYTVGTLAAFDGDCLWVADVERGQWSALKRDERILATARRDGRAVTVRVEAVAGYVDTFNRVRGLLSGEASVRKVNPKGDKVSRWSHFEPLFEAGKVKILRAPWNAAWIEELGAVPKAKHDDQADSLFLAAGEAITARRRMGLSS